MTTSAPTVPLPAPRQSTIDELGIPVSALRADARRAQRLAVELERLVAS